MKKSRFLLAIFLAFVLLITLMNVPTFSWFTRSGVNQSLSGEKMLLQTKNAYTAYNGENVTITTYPSDNGFDYSTTATTSYNGSGIYPHNRKYFCTTITNSSGSDQNVSLYANKLSIPAAVNGGSNGTLALGVNGPTRNYRDYTALTNKKYSTALNYSKRIYFQTYNIDGWGGKDIYVTFGYEYGTDTYKMTWTKNDNTYGAIFYADVPYSVDQVYFTAAGWQTAGSNGGADGTMKTVTATGLDNSLNSITQSKLFRIKNETEGTYHNRKFDVQNENINGAGIKQYCNSVTLVRQATFNTVTQGNETLLIKESTANVEYSSSNSNIFTVNNGVITGVAAGTAKLYITIKGTTYNDTVVKETEVTVTQENNYEFNDVPIVRNILIPGSGGTQEDPANVVKVYWYVINNSDSNNLDYTIDSLYIGL